MTDYEDIISQMVMEVWREPAPRNPTLCVKGLKLVAVAIVAQAVWGMARNLCPDRERASIALAAHSSFYSALPPRLKSVRSRSAGLPGYGCAGEGPQAADGHLIASVSRRTGFIALTVFLSPPYRASGPSRCCTFRRLGHF